MTKKTRKWAVGWEWEAGCRTRLLDRKYTRVWESLEKALPNSMIALSIPIIRGNLKRILDTIATSIEDATR